MAIESPKLVDKLMWGIVFLLIGGAIAAQYYFADLSLLIRVIGILVCVAVAIGLAYRTQLGQKTWQLWLESVQEVRKMVWPTRQETVQTTLAVLAMVVVMGILLWTADFFLLRAVKWLTGHWGV